MNNLKNFRGLTGSSIFMQQSSSSLLLDKKTMTLNLPNTIRDNPPGTCRIYRFNNKGEAIPVIRRRKFDMLKLSEISQV